MPEWVGWILIVMGLFLIVTSFSRRRNRFQWNPASCYAPSSQFICFVQHRLPEGSDLTMSYSDAQKLVEQIVAVETQVGDLLRKYQRCETGQFYNLLWNPWNGKGYWMTPTEVSEQAEQMEADRDHVVAEYNSISSSVGW